MTNTRISEGNKRYSLRSELTTVRYESSTHDSVLETLELCCLDHNEIEPVMPKK